MGELKLTEEQETAIDAVEKWFSEGNGHPTRPYFRLGGYAGTGKTTILQECIRRLGLTVSDVEVENAEQGRLIARCCAFTGRAARVMTSKGTRATTLHRTIYRPMVDPETGDVAFSRRVFLYAALVVVDESSMVSEMLHNDLLRFNVPILYVGDHGQLNGSCL